MYGPGLGRNYVYSSNPNEQLFKKLYNWEGMIWETQEIK